MCVKLPLPTGLGVKFLVWKWCSNWQKWWRLYLPGRMDVVGTALYRNYLGNFLLLTWEGNFWPEREKVQRSSLVRFFTTDFLQPTNPSSLLSRETAPLSAINSTNMKQMPQHSFLLTFWLVFEGWSLKGTGTRDLIWLKVVSLDSLG